MRVAAAIALMALVPITHGADDFGTALAEASRGGLQPLQMPDGRQLWRWAGKPPKGADVEMRLVDMIAQGMALATWCPTGWEITGRREASGFLIVEGRCK